MIRNICCGIDFPASLQDLKHERTVTPGLKPGAVFLSSLRDWNRGCHGEHGAVFLSSLRDWNIGRNICCGIDFPASLQDLKHERTVTPGLKPGAVFLSSLRDWNRGCHGEHGAVFLSSLRDWNRLSGFLRRIIIM